MPLLSRFRSVFPPLILAAIAGLWWIGAASANRAIQDHIAEQKKQLDYRNIATLNAMVNEYRTVRGNSPDLNLIDLYRVGMTNSRLIESPFGGYYRLDPKAGVVFSPNHFDTHPDRLVAAQAVEQR